MQNMSFCQLIHKLCCSSPESSRFLTIPRNSNWREQKNRKGIPRYCGLSLLLLKTGALQQHYESTLLAKRWSKRLLNAIHASFSQLPSPRTLKLYKKRTDYDTFFSSQAWPPVTSLKYHKRSSRCPPPSSPPTPPFLLALQRSPLVVCYLYNERGDSLVREILRTLAQKASHLLKRKLRSVSQCYLTSGILDFKLQHKRAKYRNNMLQK